MNRKILSLLLAVILLLSISLPVMAEDGVEQAPVFETIEITTSEEFWEFARNCVLDSWSQDKLILLRTDLNLGKSPLIPIPSFGGVFDGGGHSITGLEIQEAVTPAGLFGTLQPTAEIKSLHVRGTVAPIGDCSATGGIAGESFGKIEMCTFSGTVLGDRNTGTIAGSNWGTIRSCSADGNVTGNDRTGGICGYNDGKIVSCQNAVFVNTESVDPTLNPSKIKSGFTLDFSKLSDLDVASAASDTGGIVGYSSGSVLSCENTGNIGYPHIGYNLGGIAGRSCGFVENCENRGEIQGRKDVGGIIGQIEPHIQRILSPDYLETLSQQFETLGDLVGSVGSDGSKLGSETQDSIEMLSAYRSSAKDAVKELATSGIKGERNTEALSSLDSAIQGMVNTSDTLKNNIGDGVNALSSDISAISGQISAISRTFSLATEDAQQETITDISDVDLSAITEGKVLECTNTGKVIADLNVGGISGSIGLESTADPEDDMPSGKITQRRRYELKVIVDSCENIGTVQGKRSYIGGICGRMDLGLIINSQGYGQISSDSGDYVGGIAGLAGGTLRNCFARCSLSGNNYVGGICGSGVNTDYQGDSSIVSGCCSMVEITEAKQYIGAISGVNAGVFTDNHFVSDTLAGIDRVSYAHLAEPVSYKEMQTMIKLPQSLEELTLRFVADEQVIKSQSFRYGESFDSSIFPEIPQKEGFYARWSLSDLSNLHFDTVVEANYYPYITALYSTDKRPGEHPVFFVQGQFQEKDALQTEMGIVDLIPGSEQKVLERWHLSIPADGLATHTVRYLPSREKVQLYILKSGGWNAISSKPMGSYLAFDVDGSDIEIAVVTADSTIRDRLTISAGVLALILIIILITKAIKAEKVKRQCTKIKLRVLWVIIPILFAAVLAVGIWIYHPQEEIAETLHIYDIVKSYTQQPEQKMELTVNARMEEHDLDFTADINLATVKGHKISAIAQNERSLYYSNGIVYTEGGDAFRLNSAVPDYSNILGHILEISRLVQTDEGDGIFTIQAEGIQASEVTKLLLPSLCDFLPEDMKLSVELKTEDKTLKQVSISGAGNLKDSVKTPFSVSAVLDILQPTGTEIPNVVTEQILSGISQPQEIFSDELIQLLQAWSRLREKDRAAVQVQLKADCGPISANDTFFCYQWKIGNHRIYGTEKTGTMLYFSDDCICDEQGHIINLADRKEPNISQLPDILYSAFRNAQFKCHQEDTSTVYTVSLRSSGMKQIAEALLPEIQDMNVSYGDSSIQLILDKSDIRSIQVICQGNIRLVAASADISLEMLANLTDMEIGSLPEQIIQTLTSGYDVDA